ncbi:MAG: hypothetical protein QF790_00685 [Gammaproteobacteria bacterium]|jgi:hypothetical protein|nr:hypothetical protein [Gammaproteobacteria bacterium]MDP6615671.1 hypothetical protein [Gammaproteobacteria bacterium]MDP6694698.1 hypothetical protein [Gammaproteobacteria bacterium]MDP7041241.1 hypothetical protein [Gammaproteobacteria bacterium]
MQAILGAFWQIALLRQGPENLPDSRFLLALAALAYVAANMIVIVTLYPPQLYLPLLLVDLLLLGVWTTGVLFLFSLLARARRTLTALLGAGALIQLLSFPFSLLPQTVSTLPLILMLLWSVAVNGHIIARALSKSFGVGVAFAVVYFILVFELVGRMIPAD